MNLRIHGLMTLAAYAVSTAAAASTASFVEGQLIVRFKDGGAENARAALNPDLFEIERVLVPSMNLFLIRVDPSLDIKHAQAILGQNEQIIYSQLDHRIELRERVPNDPEFSQQWSLSNASGTGHISATRAWELGTGGKDKAGNDVVVAIVDSGMDTSHADLMPNVWINPNEIPGNGVDDDQNGYVDDIHGWNGYSNTGKISSSSHGTHVAGIIGASGNNGSQIAGVNWNVKLMAVQAASGATSVIASGYGYVIEQKKLWLETRGAKGANIVATNSSFGIDFADCKSGDYPVWNDLYESMGKLGILSAAATANRNIDVDVRGDVPTSCGSEFIVAVTNTTREDTRNLGAAYGARSIDLGAPGTSILSTLPGNAVGTKTGTSMATPHVAGAIAFLHSIASPSLHQLSLSDPAAGALAIKSLLLQGTDQTESMKNVTVSGGRLNLHRSAVLASDYGAGN